MELKISRFFVNFYWDSKQIASITEQDIAKLTYHQKDPYAVPASEEEAWARAVLASATEALQAAEARFQAAEAALEAYRKAARARRWNGLVGERTVRF